MADPPDQAMAAIALRHHGNITRRQLLRHGLDQHAIAHRVRVGRLHRVYAGVYSVGRQPLTALERAAAAVLAQALRSVISPPSGCGDFSTAARHASKSRLPWTDGLPPASRRKSARVVH
jgi:hypothetical protein